MTAAMIPSEPGAHPALAISRHACPDDWNPQGRTNPTHRSGTEGCEERADAHSGACRMARLLVRPDVLRRAPGAQSADAQKELLERALPVVPVHLPGARARASQALHGHIQRRTRCTRRRPGNTVDGSQGPAQDDADRRALAVRVLAGGGDLRGHHPVSPLDVEPDSSGDAQARAEGVQYVADLQISGTASLLASSASEQKLQRGIPSRRLRPGN